jgi:predicted TIM-barrel fold metal-dependent hydrolase
VPYVERRCRDADSHLMEHAGWLEGHADPSIRDRLRPYPDGPPRLVGASAEARVARAEPYRFASGWASPGASDPAERSRALDALGFEKQLVFPTFSLAQFAFSKDLDVLYGGLDAHNRAMAEFCADDERLCAVGMASLKDIERGLACLDRALELGCDAIWISHTPAGGGSPGHVDNDPFWARLQEAGRPFVSHIGFGPNTIAEAYHQTGRPKPPDFLGGGENLRAKDYPVLHHAHVAFLTAMVLDGVFERFPGLKGGVIEAGASWVPGFLRTLDHAKSRFRRHEPLLSELKLEPADYIRRQMKFTPFAFEDVGWLIAQEGAELFLFSTDYPHPEGGRDPYGRFEASLDARGIGPEDRERFYSRNFDELMGLTRVA